MSDAPPSPAAPGGGDGPDGSGAVEGGPAADGAIAPAELDHRVGRDRFLRMATLFTAVLAAVAAGIDLLSERVDLLADLAPPVAAPLAIGLVGGGLAGAFLAGLIALPGPLRKLPERLTPLVRWDEFGVHHYAWLAIVAGVGEEVLFRGALQPWIGLWPAAIVFALLHATSAPHVAVALAAGAALGYLYRDTGGLWAPIAAHFAIDLVTGLALAHALRRGWIDARGRRPTSPV